MVNNYVDTVKMVVNDLFTIVMYITSFVGKITILFGTITFFVFVILKFKNLTSKKFKNGGKIKNKVVTIIQYLVIFVLLILITSAYLTFFQTLRLTDRNKVIIYFVVVVMIILAREIYYRIGARKQ